MACKNIIASNWSSVTYFAVCRHADGLSRCVNGAGEVETIMVDGGDATK
jgi:hypothetical protein